MDIQELSEYPTPEQIEEIWEAHKRGGPGAIAEVLQSWRAERQAQSSQPEEGTESEAPQK